MAFALIFAVGLRDSNKLSVQTTGQIILVVVLDSLLDTIIFFHVEESAVKGMKKSHDNTATVFI